jgi:hypothetical protein
MTSGMTDLFIPLIPFIPVKFIAFKGPWNRRDYRVALVWLAAPSAYAKATADKRNDYFTLDVRRWTLDDLPTLNIER